MGHAVRPPVDGSGQGRTGCDSGHAGRARGIERQLDWRAPALRAAHQPGPDQPGAVPAAGSTVSLSRLVSQGYSSAVHSGSEATGSTRTERHAKRRAPTAIVARITTVRMSTPQLAFSLDRLYRPRRTRIRLHSHEVTYHSIGHSAPTDRSPFFKVRGQRRCLRTQPRRLFGSAEQLILGRGRRPLRDLGPKNRKDLLCGKLAARDI